MPGGSIPGGLVVLAVVAVLGVGAAGYAVGASGGPELRQARVAGIALGRTEAGDVGVAPGYAAGLTAGRQAGDRETFSAAYQRAYAAAKSNVLP